MTLEKMLQAIAKYETCLYSCSIEGNEFADKHINKIKNIEKFLGVHDGRKDEGVNKL